MALRVGKGFYFRLVIEARECDGEGGEGNKKAKLFGRKAIAKWFLV